MTDFQKQFITHSQNYVLLDSQRDIRATAYDLEGIMKARIFFGWGTIHRMELKNNILKIGKEVK